MMMMMMMRMANPQHSKQNKSTYRNLHDHQDSSNTRDRECQ